MVHKSGFGLFTEAAIIQVNSSILLSVAIIDAHTHALKEAPFFPLRWVSAILPIKEASFFLKVRSFKFFGLNDFHKRFEGKKLPQFKYSRYGANL